MSGGPQGAKRRGTEGENEARKALEAMGFAVTRAAGSMGAADLIAMRDDKTFAIGVKRGEDPRHAPAERQKLRGLAAKGGAEPWEYLIQIGDRRQAEVRFRRLRGVEP